MLITVHFAQTLDGRLATRTGDSRWISGPQTLRLAHQLRARHEAILVGVGTIIADDPQLTTRLIDGPSPLRVVLDSRLRIPEGSRVLNDGATKTVVATTSQAVPSRLGALRALGADVLVLPQDRHGRVELTALITALEKRGLRSLLVEGGSAVITSVLRAGICDELVVCIAPRVLGSGIESVGDLGISRLSEALAIGDTSIERMGEDIVFRGRPRRALAATG